MNGIAMLSLLITASTWLFTYAMHAVVVCMAALLSGRYLVRSPQWRTTLYRAALVVPLVTATALTAGVRAPLAEINLAAMVRRQVAGRPNEVMVRQSVVRTRSGETRLDQFATDSVALRIAATAVALAAAGALAGLVLLLLRHRAFRIRLGLRLPVDRHPELVRRYRLTTSTSLGAPVAIGIREICVPAPSFGLLAPDEQQSVIAHESAHLTRRDPIWFAVGDIIVALFPWQPLARPLVREARRAAEFCCDDAVVAQVGDGRPMVRSLATFAARFDPAETALASSCGGSPLEERARRLLGPATPRRSMSRWAAALVVALLAGAASLAPAVTTRTHPADLRSDRPGHRMIIKEIDVRR